MPTRPWAQPKGGIGYPAGNPHFGQDFRDLYLSAHLPIITDGGVDFKIGRMNTIIGYNGFLAPYRPFYSSDYQFFYSQDGAFTGFLTNLHVYQRSGHLERDDPGCQHLLHQRSSRSFCYIGQVNYWLTDEQRTRLTASVYCGPNAIFAAPGLAGTSTRSSSSASSKTGARASPRSSRSTWAGTPIPRSAPARGMACTRSASSTSPRSSTSSAERNGSTTCKGTRTGIDTNYAEVTLGLN